MEDKLKSQKGTLRTNNFEFFSKSGLFCLTIFKIRDIFYPRIFKFRQFAYFAI